MIVSVRFGDRQKAIWTNEKGAFALLQILEGFRVGAGKQTGNSTDHYGGHRTTYTSQQESSHEHYDGEGTSDHAEIFHSYLLFLVFSLKRLLLSLNLVQLRFQKVKLVSKIVGGDEPIGIECEGIVAAGAETDYGVAVDHFGLDAAEHTLSIHHIGAVAGHPFDIFDNPMAAFIHPKTGVLVAYCAAVAGDNEGLLPSASDNYFILRTHIIMLFLQFSWLPYRESLHEPLS